MNRKHLLVGPAIAAALLLALLILVACAPAAPTAPSAASAPDEAAAAADETPMPGVECVSINASGNPEPVPCVDDETLRAVACEDIVPFQGDAAFALNDADKLLGWTLGVNFSDAAIVDDRPIGCLHLYARNEVSATYVPIDNGGILFNTCTVEGGVSIDDVAANFCAGADLTIPRWVTCSVNLAGWLQGGAFVDYIWRNYPDAADPVAKFLETPDDGFHQYENFAMIAKASWQEEQCALDDARLPVVRYINSGSPITLSLIITADQTLRFDANCPENQPTWDESGDQHWLWYNVISDTAHASPHLTYDHQRDNEPVESCDPGAGDATVNFFIGPSELWIGHDPGTGESFMGDLDGILIDPFDSKPPVASIND